ncbi:response regulator [Haloterrigena sp. SYSU A558-1]|uniref:Response regulator n=1 Tax=Haloterrigena gelatinilytica TaxID=2741724 RepID=A0A8J8KG68_9EURY|nr:response regulator [Haloterrigena gelatinilytica]NUB92246.1 response regulator [Haloterrigena gelatinilytica]NUC71924.1 response regulator [Haloterrigena gelatinilytica]
MTSGNDSIEDVIDILLVEPNPGDTRLFTENFRDAKLMNTVHAVSDGDAALDFLHQRGEYADASPPDIILLEPQLPGTSGMDVLAELDGEPILSDIPVAVLTSSEMGEAIVQSHGLEADFYVRKPVEPADFVSFVDEIEEFWFAIVREPSET